MLGGTHDHCVIPGASPELISPLSLCFSISFYTLCVCMGGWLLIALDDTMLYGFLTEAFLLSGHRDLPFYELLV